MFPLKKIFPILLIVFFLLAACATPSGSSSTPSSATETITPPPTSTPTPLPTASSPNDSIIWDNLQVAMDQLEITGEYLTDFGSTRSPSAGTKFLWVHVLLKNTGQIEKDVPIYEHYSILYAATEIKPIYGHRQGYAEYTTLASVIFPNQELDGWLRFDIPATAELKDMRFVFLPESAQVGVSYSSPSYPYADDKPTYVWACER